MLYLPLVFRFHNTCILLLFMATKNDRTLSTDKADRYNYDAHKVWEENSANLQTCISKFEKLKNVFLNHTINIFLIVNQTY